MPTPSFFTPTMVASSVRDFDKFRTNTHSSIWIMKRGLRVFWLRLIWALVLATASVAGWRLLGASICQRRRRLLHARAHSLSSMGFLPLTGGLAKGKVKQPTTNNEEKQQRQRWGEQYATVKSRAAWGSQGNWGSGGSFVAVAWVVYQLNKAAATTSVAISNARPAMTATQNAAPVASCLLWHQHWHGNACRFRSAARRENKKLLIIFSHFSLLCLPQRKREWQSEPRTSVACCFGPTK